MFYRVTVIEWSIFKILYITVINISDRIYIFLAAMLSQILSREFFFLLVGKMKRKGNHKILIGNF